MLIVTVAMFAVGLLLGFVGAGGSGFIISILTVGFGYPLYTSLGTALSAMAFSSLSGAYSHYRDGNAKLKTGLIVGAAGAIGALGGTRFAVAIPESSLKWFTAGMLMLSSLALWARMHMVAKRAKEQGRSAEEDEGLASGARGGRFWSKAAAVGIVCGLLSGMFGIGATPFIQIGLMTVLGMSARFAAGTTMLVILPIAIAGGAGFWQAGFLDVPLLAQVVCGTMTGAFIGAKFTKRVPPRLLKTAMVLVPMTGAIILFL